MSAPPSVNLELIETAVLAQELLSRFDHAVFMGLRTNEFGNRNHGFMKRWIGNAHTCAGLCDDLRDAVLSEMRSRIERDIPESG